MTAEESLQRLKEGNRRYYTASVSGGDISQARRRQTAEQGQSPFAVVISCTDSRVIPEAIFSCGLGDLYTLRVAGNVVDARQISTVSYAVRRLHCPLAVVLGHTRCGIVENALSHRMDSFILGVTDEILKSAGAERDPLRVCRLNVRRGVQQLRESCRTASETKNLRVVGAIYDVDTGEVRWL